MAGICSNCSTREINNHPYRVTIDSPLGARVLAIFTPALLSRLFLKSVRLRVYVREHISETIISNLSFGGVVIVTRSVLPFYG